VKREGSVVITIVNKDARAAEARIAAGNQFHRGAVLRLTGPSLQSEAGAMLGGSSIDAAGKWRAANAKPVRFQRGYRLLVPAGSAAFVTLSNE
jgi:hypothetical protein